VTMGTVGGDQSRGGEDPPKSKCSQTLKGEIREKKKSGKNQFVFSEKKPRGGRKKGNYKARGHTGKGEKLREIKKKEVQEERT